MSAATSGDLGVAADGVTRSADGFDLVQQGGLIVFQLDEDASLRLTGGLDGFFWQCIASSVTMQPAS